MRGLGKNCTLWRRQTDRQTDRQTHGHGDSMTNSAQWGRVGENCTFMNICWALHWKELQVIGQISGELVACLHTIRTLYFLKISLSAVWVNEGDEGYQNNVKQLLRALFGPLKGIRESVLKVHWENQDQDQELEQDPGDG